jgi:hypothetical protein
VSGDLSVMPFGQKLRFANRKTAQILFLSETMQNYHQNGPINPTTRALIHETIAFRAYELWEKYGRPENHALDDWLEAERELMSGRRQRRSNPPQVTTITGDMS